VNDPHVSHLRYRLIPASFVELVDGPAIEVETNAFRAKLAESYLILEMRAHFASESEARCVGDPFANGWSIASGLRRGRAEVAFEFEAAEIVDRAPPSDGQGHASASLRMPMPQLQFTATSTPIQIGFPRAAPSFLASREVEVLWARHQAYVEGREPIASMAYFCLTFVETLAGGDRRRAAEKYKISHNVLQRIGHLTSDGRGDHLTARKIVPTKPLEPLSQSDLLWLEAAVRIMIWRVGAPPAREDALISIDEVLGNPALAP
jgi:hypothetical protein